MTETEIREYAAQQRVDFDALLAGAASHFQSPVIVGRAGPLSDAELEAWFEDDQQAMADGAPFS